MWLYIDAIQRCLQVRMFRSYCYLQLSQNLSRYQMQYLSVSLRARLLPVESTDFLIRFSLCFNLPVMVCRFGVRTCDRNDSLINVAWRFGCGNDWFRLNSLPGIYFTPRSSRPFKLRAGALSTVLNIWARPVDCRWSKDPYSLSSLKNSFNSVELVPPSWTNF